MELVGEQKRIQALFSELRLADETTAPRFAAVWNRAETRSSRTWQEQARVFNFSFVAATALLICALVSLALWSKYSQLSPQQAVVVATKTPVVVPVQPVKGAPVKPLLSDERHDRINAIARAKKLAAQRRALMQAANLKTTREAKVISSWQSPTTALLKSQNDELLKSLPQLSESADELKSFLTNTPK